MQPRFADIAHVDMLHPARRMWREEEVECRLTYLEQALCGHEREGDVPGFEIPSRYFHYVRSGDARPLAAVLEHNRLDIVALAMLTARASQLLDEGPSAATTAREAFGMGRLYERAGMIEQALACFQRAAGVDGTRAAAILLRRISAALCSPLQCSRGQLTGQNGCDYRWSNPPGTSHCIGNGAGRRARRLHLSALRKRSSANAGRTQRTWKQRNCASV